MSGHLWSIPPTSHHLAATLSVKLALYHRKGLEPMNFGSGLWCMFQWFQWHHGKTFYLYIIFLICFQQYVTSCGSVQGLSGGQHLLDHGRCHGSTDGSMFTSNRRTQGEIPLPSCFDVLSMKWREGPNSSKQTDLWGILKLRDTSTLSNYCSSILVCATILLVKPPSLIYQSCDGKLSSNKSSCGQ